MCLSEAGAWTTYPMIALSLMRCYCKKHLNKHFINKKKLWLKVLHTEFSRERERERKKNQNQTTNKLVKNVDVNASCQWCMC